VILRWEQGRPVVDALLSRGQLTRVTPNRDLAATLLTQAHAHIASGAAVVHWSASGCAKSAGQSVERM
jgi:hypothetical protein